MQQHEVVCSPVVERKYVFTRFKAENELSLMALVACMMSNSFHRVEISLNSFLRELSRDCKKVTKSMTSNSEVSNPFDSAVCGKSKSCPFNLKNPNLCCGSSPLRLAQCHMAHWQKTSIGAPVCLRRFEVLVLKYCGVTLRSVSIALK